MLLTKEEVQVALNKTIKSVNELSIGTSNGGFKAPVCIVCNSLCGHKQLHWISTSLIRENKKWLTGASSLPAVIRQFYSYKGRGYKAWMDAILLSPYASHKQIITKPNRNKMDRFTCCYFCFEDLESKR